MDEIYSCYIEKGTEPSLEFVLPFDVSQIKKARVVVRCPVTGAIVKKETAALTMTEQTVSCRLTQEDTFLFPCNTYAEVQLRILTVENVPLKTEVFHAFVTRCLDEEVI